MQSTAQLWLVYRLTRSASLLGVFAFSNQIPILCLSSFGGYFADRFDRRKGVLWTQTISAILAFVLAALTVPGIERVWEIILIAFLAGIVNAFDVPIRQAFLIQMTSKDDLPNAIALNSSIFNSARVVGPALAGFAIAWIGEGWCFLLNAISFLAVIVALLMMRIERTPSRPADGSPLQSLLQGFRYAMNDQPMRSALLLLSLISMAGLQYSVLMPIFANDVLRRGPRGLGLLMSFAGVGAVLGALNFAARKHYKNLVQWIGAASAACSLGLILFSQSRAFALSAALLLIIGFAVTSQMAATNTIVQLRVPDHLRGRVMAVYATMFMGVQPLGALLVGGVARRIGAPHALAIFGSVCLLGSLLFIFREVMRPPQPQTTADL